ncbi:MULTISPECIES: hypothetical protein [Metabacillus]|uniref:Abortive phage infection protein n=3 Tax=Metabacillus TaxID=2675233 RepID=A0A179T2I6_9BACI|nr:MULTISPECIES: hypothetical protein [Metabacillus]OAS86683.1 hypothetical protein A6K24_04005 [Metabacillus litoralis]QNF29246.1 hypothetical protein HUW50_18220 [Metabacillus sp. KUDC1714]
MDERTIHEILDKLKSGELHEYHVGKDLFLSFRNILINRTDFKHFRGIAQQGGSIIYRYLKEPRS